MKKILVTRKLINSSEELAKKLFEVKLNKEDKILSKEELIRASEGCDGILSSLTEKFDSNLISKLSEKIKIISNFAVGFGNIDIKAAKKRNIIVTNTPNVLTILKSTPLNFIWVMVDIIDVGIIIAKDVPTAKCIMNVWSSPTELNI